MKRGIFTRIEKLEVAETAVVKRLLHKSVFSTLGLRFYWVFEGSVVKKGVYATASFTTIQCSGLSFS